VQQVKNEDVGNKFGILPTALSNGKIQLWVELVHDEPMPDVPHSAAIRNSATHMNADVTLARGEVLFMLAPYTKSVNGKKVVGYICCAVRPEIVVK
jgi:hypothetical protein